MEAAPAIQIPVQRSDFVGQEHKLRVKGVDYVLDRRVTTTVDRDGNRFKKTVIIKKIGNQSYQVNYLSVNQTEYGPTVETQMSTEKLEAFKEDWKNNWKPSEWSDPGYLPE